MANFVPVPASDIESMLQGLRFERTVQYDEVVYVRRSARNPDVVMKVYTSIRRGDTLVRPSGKDAIRVCVVFDNGRKSFGIAKLPAVPRVHSVDSVLRRIRERLQDASKRAKEWMDESDVRQAAWQSRVTEKAAFARRERSQEAEGFLSDPDYRSMLGAAG